MRRARVAGALGTALALALGVAPSCTRATDEFCEALSQRRDLGDLARAISTRDEPAIAAGLEDLRELERTAPAELLDDVRQVLDTVTETVRAVTKAADDGDDPRPVDLTSLNDQLARAEPAAQRISAFADRNCAIGLDEG